MSFCSFLLSHPFQEQNNTLELNRVGHFTTTPTQKTDASRLEEGALLCTALYLSLSCPSQSLRLY